MVLCNRSPGNWHRRKKKCVLRWLPTTSKTTSLDKSGSHLDKELRFPKFHCFSCSCPRWHPWWGCHCSFYQLSSSRQVPQNRNIIHALHNLHIVGSRDTPAAPKEFGFRLVGLVLTCSRKKQEKQHSLANFSASLLLFCWSVLINSVPRCGADWRTLYSLVLVPWSKTPPGLVLEVGRCRTGSQGRCKWHLQCVIALHPFLCTQHSEYPLWTCVGSGPWTAASHQDDQSSFCLFVLWEIWKLGCFWLKGIEGPTKRM